MKANGTNRVENPSEACFDNWVMMMCVFPPLCCLLREITPSLPFGFQVQLVSGASPLAYWLSAYLWDVLLFFSLSCLVMLTFAAYGRDASKVRPVFEALSLVVHYVNERRCAKA